MEVRGIQLVISSLERAIMVREGRNRRDEESILPYFKRPDYQGIPLDEEKFKRLAHKDHTGRAGPEGCGGRAGETR